MARRGLFITGTDTGVGKTRVAGAIARHLSDLGRSVGVLKPVATGGVRSEEGLRSEDADALIEAVGGGPPREHVNPICLEPPIAPPAAARLEGGSLEFPRVLESVRQALGYWEERRVDLMIVEGIGGLLCPLTEGATVADLAIYLDYPLIVVARAGLGTVNHTLLTLEAAKLRGLRVAGVILNAIDTPGDLLAEASSSEEIARRLGSAAFLLELARLTDSRTWYDEMRGVDWLGWSQPPRVTV